MSKQEFSIKEAAKRLDVSESTVRRRIHNGELKAVKKMGQHGEQWFIPADQINTAQQVIDVVEVKEPIDKEELKQMVIKALENRENQLLALVEEKNEEFLSDLERTIEHKLEQQKDYNRQFIKTLEEQFEKQQQKLEKQEKLLERRDRQLTELIRAVQLAKNEKRSFWQRVKDLFNS